MLPGLAQGKSLAQGWCLRQPDPGAVAALEARGIARLVARLLVARGLADPARAEEHLRASPMALHDPSLLPGMEAATERIERAIRDRETILVHGDYDVDGVTGTALLMRLFEELGARAVWHIPNRLEHGYSFGSHSIERAREEGARVVISVDNGTSAHAVIAQLLELGIDTVVTDHHEASPGPLPAAAAIVNPKLPGSSYPWREICGGAVAFKLAWGLAQRMNGARRVSDGFKRFLEEATAYVAIATVCDVVPLRDENRVFARFGLKALESTKNVGLRALLEIAGLAGRALSAEDVAFQVGPRINASGRLGSAELAVELLLARELEGARQNALALDALNRKRREIETAVLAEARAAARELADPEEHPVLVLAGRGWHQGVVGIVAARLCEEFGRPALVIGLPGGDEGQGEVGRGSARTVGRFNVLEAIAGAAPHLLRFGGHEQAAGLEIDPANVAAARAAICERARSMLDGAGHPEQRLEIDCELAFEELTPATMRQIEPLSPFGAENEAPVFLAREVYLAQPPRSVGSESAHLLLELRRGTHVLKALGFGLAARLPELALGKPIDAVFTPKWNTFRGETNLELQLLDFRAARA
jgi:single-stranded-DNA-specific exonuclease